MEYILVLFMNGYAVDISAFRTMRDCANHALTVTRALQQVESEAHVRCEERLRRIGDPAPPR
jgi:predicted transcriptional regulator of viral defense system